MNFTEKLSNTLTAAANFIAQFNNPITVKDNSFAVSFGDPESVLNSGDWSWWSGYQTAGNYHIPPIDYRKLANLMDANAYHGPIIHKKKELLLLWMNKSPWISRIDQERMVLDFLVTGNLYAQETYNKLGRVFGYQHKSALDMFRGFELMQPDSDFYVEDTTRNPLINNPTLTTYQRGEVYHLQTAAIKNKFYGSPAYFGGVQSVLLSEASTLFKRKFFINGHTGGILVANDANFSEDTAKEIAQKIKQNSLAGNFTNLFLNIPRSQSREPIKFIPIGNAATQDEYNNISSITEDAMCAMHQIPPSVASIVPANAGGFGKPSEAFEYFYHTGIVPMQNKLMEFNDLTGKPILTFSKPDFLTTTS